MSITFDGLRIIKVVIMLLSLFWLYSSPLLGAEQQHSFDQAGCQFAKLSPQSCSILPDQFQNKFW